MPYIRQEQRQALADGATVIQEGELNYAVTQLIIDYLLTNGLSYGTINDIRGAVLGAEMEFERRVAGPYEDKKIRENGDVYPSSLLGKENNNGPE